MRTSFLKIHRVDVGGLDMPSETLSIVKLDDDEMFDVLEKSSDGEHIEFIPVKEIKNLLRQHKLL